MATLTESTWPRAQLESMRSLGQFMSSIWNADARLTLVTVLLRIIRAIIPIAVVWVAKLIIDEVAATMALFHAGKPIDAGAPFHLLTILILVEFALAVLADVAARVVEYVEAMLAAKFADEMSIRLLVKAGELDLASHEDSEIQDQIERARRQVNGRSSLLGQSLGLLQSALSLILFAAGIVAYAPWLIILILLALLPAFIGDVYFNVSAYLFAFARTPERRALDYLRQLGTNLENAKEVKVFHLTPFLVERYSMLARRLYAADRALAAKTTWWGAVLTAIGTVAYYFAYGWIVWSAAEGRYSIGTLTFLAASFRQLRALGDELLTSVSQISNQTINLDELYSFFTLTSKLTSPESPATFPSRIADGITFENVSYRYPGAENWTLKSVSLEIMTGQTLAIVGENGAGKTTLVKLLARLYDPTEGRVLLDGRDIREFDLKELHARIGIIFQDFARYALSARENIVVGGIDFLDDQDRVIIAAQKSSAHTVISQLPNGYEQLLGRRFKGGIDLSGGEWQKIALARLYMRDAQILVMDEPTASLDPRSEFEVFQRFKELRSEKTAILISHRFANVRIADKIVVLTNGRVEEMGTHEELVRGGGRYEDLFRLQAAGYRP
jgi:ATP-binding cassette subfamily B protein